VKPKTRLKPVFNNRNPVCNRKMVLTSQHSAICSPPSSHDGIEHSTTVTAIGLFAVHQIEAKEFKSPEKIRSLYQKFNSNPASAATAK